MRFNFASKIAVTIGVAIIITLTGSGFFFYRQTRIVVFDLIANRLRDTLKVSALLFQEKELNHIRELRSELEKYVDKYDYRTVFDSLENGEFKPFIPKEVRDEVMAKKSFRDLVQRLRQIRAAGQDGIYSTFERINQSSLVESVIQYSYILVKYQNVSSQHESDNIYFFLADADHETSGEFDANPFGNLYKVEQACFGISFQGSVRVEDDFILEESSGTLLTGSIPIYSKNGEILAVLGMDYEITGAVNELKTLSIYLYISMFIGICISLFVSIVFSRNLAKSIKILRIGAEKVQNKDFTTRVFVKSRDEFALLADAFNSMVKTISDYSREMSELNKVYFRFVPKEFLDFLNIQDIKTIKLGDCSEREMTVLFTDIRSFTSLSEQMKSQDIFAFLNSYLSYISPVIKSNNGFIDKFIGDSMMALFPSALDGVLAAIEMRGALSNFNKERKLNGLDPIDCGIGLNTGELTLGTIGTSARMETTVISDVVNLASRLEGYTKIVSSSIIMSDGTYKSMISTEGYKEKGILFRFLGRIRVRGKKKSTGIYQILTSLDFDLDLVSQLNPTFEKAIVLFSKKQYVEAAELFEEVLSYLSGDSVSAFYLGQSKSQILSSVSS